MKTAILSTAFALTLALVASQEEAPPKPTPLVVGAEAPLFQLNDHSGKTVRVGGKSKSWTVLAFYPKALTPG